MSQRVQKGNTVFRPVAKPRPRAGGDSRQSSALPEPSSTPGPSNASSQDGAHSRAQSAMPPPASIPQRPPPEPFSVHSSTNLAPHGALTTSSEPSSSQPIPSAVPSTTSVQPPPMRTILPPSRMPPRIGTSQPNPAHSPSGVAISMPSRNMIRAPAPPPAHTPIVPTRPTTSNDAMGQPNHAHTQSSFSPLDLSMLSGAPPPMSYTIDSSQIDPQLMGPSGFAGMAPPQFQAESSSPPPAVQGPTVVLDDAPAVKVDSTRRSQRKKLDAAGENATEEGNQDNAEDDTPPPKKRRSKKANAEEEENASQSGAKKRKRSENAEPRRSRKRAPSPPPFDPDADPGEELDPTAVTMAALCDDNGRGRVSSKAAQIVSNHAAWRAANREKRARMKAAMEAKKYGRNIEDEEDGTTQSAVQKAASSEPEVPGSASRSGSVALDPDASASAAEGAESAEKDGFDYSEDMAVSRFNVQVRIGANGETIIDEQSLFVSRDEEHATEDYTHVEESDFTKFVNSATYSKKLRGSRWSAEETELFYDALSQFGENYELISYVLPGRDRKACKNKFKAEDKKNPARITYCLKNRRPYDIATLSRMTGKDFSGPTPEIRAPTSLRSTELGTTTDAPAPPSPKVVRKKSRTPSAHEAGVEIVGNIDDVGKDDFEVGPDGAIIGA
ncbi:hypothetical protein C8Q77DRAFT_1081822 [Trametes polyzona]|nr:hypothetical protein C8Q77DRAFT_1081822 [Trametes polyzona]